MTDELFELCRAVYEKTGWYDVEKFYVKSFTKKDAFKNAVWELESYSAYAENMTKEEFSQSNTVPLYNSDYLLEKLPKSIPFGTDELRLGVNVWWSGGWQAHYGMYDWKSAIADTPLKALLKLTLALSEAGELENSKS